MDLLIDIALYGTGAAVLIFLVLVLIGFVGGLTSFVQAWRDERLQRRSTLRPDRAARHVDAGGTTPGMVVETLIYPSRRFNKDSCRLIDRGVAFMVTVRSGSRKRAAVERELPLMVYLRSPQGGLWRSFFDKLRTSELWACVAYAADDDRYTVSYVMEPDITIRFEPVRQHITPERNR